MRLPFTPGLRARLILLQLAAFAALGGLIVWQSIEDRDVKGIPNFPRYGN